MTVNPSRLHTKIKRVGAPPRLLVGTCASLAVAASLTSSPAHAAAAPAPLTAYVAVAEGQFASQANLLVSGSASNVESFFPDLSDRTRALAQRQQLLALAQKLDSVGVGISSTKVKLNDCIASAGSGGVDVSCTKSTQLSFGQQGLEMSVTEYVVSVKLGFSLDPTPRLRSVISSSAESSQLLPLDEFPTAGLTLSKVANPKSVRVAATTPATFTGLTTSAKLVAVSYALQYALNPNPAYIVYSNDCTNFVSQAMRAAGWTFTGNGSYSQMADSRYWNYYGGIYPSISYTPYAWRVADYLYDFATGESGRGLIIGQYGPASAKSNQTSLFPGDIVFYAIGNGGALEPKNHVAIITNRGDGIVKLSQHSTNHLNNEFSKWVDRAVAEAAETNEPVQFFFVRT